MERRSQAQSTPAGELLLSEGMEPAVTEPAGLEGSTPQEDVTRAACAAGAKILFLVDGMESITAGGTERQLLQFVRLAQQTGAEPQICILRDTRWLTEAVAGCPVRHYQIGSVRSVSGMKRIADIVRWMRLEEFDILQTLLADASVIGPLLGKAAGIPVLVGTRRNLDLFNRRPTAAEKLLLRLSDRFLDQVQVNSRAVAEHVHRWEGVPERRLQVVYNGIDLDAMRVTRAMGEPVRQRLDLQEGQLLVGNLSGLRRVKRLDLFIRAAEMAVQSHSHLRFVIVGEGDQRPEIEELIRKGGLEGVITLAGTQEDVRPWLAAMDIGVLCSDAEGFSNSLLEYMAAGLPIIATDVGGNREALEGAGVLIRPDDPESLAEAIGSFTLKSTRDRLGAAALQAVKRYDLGAAQERVRSLYENLAQKARKRGKGNRGAENGTPFAT